MVSVPLPTRSLVLVRRIVVFQVSCKFNNFGIFLDRSSTTLLGTFPSCFLILNLTQSFVFAAPPYNFSAAAVGYTNFAVVSPRVVRSVDFPLTFLSQLGGAILGVFTGGPLGDWLSARATKKNRNIREPEMRLPALWPFCALLLLGSTIVAVGYERQWDWKVIIVLGYGAIGWQVATLPALAMAYTIDSYKPVAGEYLVAMTVNKNLWGYGERARGQRRQSKSGADVIFCRSISISNPVDPQRWFHYPDHGQHRHDTWFHLDWLDPTLLLWQDDARMDQGVLRAQHGG